MNSLAEFLHTHVDSGRVPGAVALVSRPGEDPDLIAAGALQQDAIVRIQSMTKIITTVAALRLVEAGRIALDDPVTTWLPELAERRVLVRPDAELSDTVPAEREITLRHLLTNTAGYGMILQPSPLQQAMAANGTEAGPDPVAYGADEWLARLAELPLAYQPGEGWRYHHCFGILGVLLSRVTGGPLGEHLEADVFGPLGMSDTAYWVPVDKLDRLPAAYGPDPATLVETEPAGGGFYAGPPPFDVSHAELVSTAADFHRFLRALLAGELVSAEHLAELSTDQVPADAKHPDSFFPGFFDDSGWGFGVAVLTTGPHRGRWGWSGGQGTTFYVDPDGVIGILLTQVEMGERMWPLLTGFNDLSPAP